MKPPSLLFIHGWGFDRTIWDPLRAFLSGLDSLASDRGYFGEPFSPEPAGPVLVVGHSLGALLALREPPPGCVGLVAINGFDTFADRPDAPGVPVRTIDRMIDKFGAAPAEVVGEFRRRCGSEARFAEIDPGLLGQDLLLLRECDERDRSAGWHLPLLSLQGDEDPILPPALRSAAFAGAPQFSIQSCPGGGHLLPLSHGTWCAAHIAALVETLA